MAAILIGPRKSGRSLLARIFAAKSGGTIIDDAECCDDETLFHAWNNAQSRRRPLLLIADAAPPLWSVGLPDLQSRLAATPTIVISPPDDVMTSTLFAQLFHRRGLDARPDLIAWLTQRTERSYVAIERTVDLLDQLALESRKRLSIPAVKTLLSSAGLLPVN